MHTHLPTDRIKDGTCAVMGPNLYSRDGRWGASLKPYPCPVPPIVIPNSKLLLVDGFLVIGFSFCLLPKVTYLVDQIKSDTY